MLRLLSIQNIGVIERLELALGEGLNVLTGETGSGKSIIVDALSLMLGARAEEAMLRADADQARVEGAFALSGAPRERLDSVLRENGLDDEATDDDGLILTREIHREGRNLCRVNGRIVPLRVLAAIGEALGDVHGQGQQVSLLRPAEQMRMLDDFAGLMGLRRQVWTTVRDLAEVRKDLAAVTSNERDVARRADRLAFEVSEIDASLLRPGEEAELERERTVLGSADHLRTLAAEAYGLLAESEGRRGAIELLGRAARSVRGLAAVDATLAPLVEVVDGLGAQAEEVARTLRAYEDSIEFEPGRLQEVEERLALIAQLKRKYGDTVSEIIAYGRQAAEELAGMVSMEDRKAALREKESALLGQLGDLGARLSLGRREAAERLARAVETELADLAMDGTRVEVEVAQVEHPDGVLVSSLGGAAEPLRYAFTAAGIDRVQFLVAPNPGEPLRPLARIASGGETSRLMLAFLAALTNAGPVPTLTFDEVDAGVGGRVGTAVGKKLWTLARGRQVLCVTHLPQAACFADRHVRVAKSLVAERTVAIVEPLSPDARVEEISQMLGATGKSARHNAWEMMEQATRWKRAQDTAPEVPSLGDASETPGPQLALLQDVIGE